MCFEHVICLGSSVAAACCCVVQASLKAASFAANKQAAHVDIMSSFTSPQPACWNVLDCIICRAPAVAAAYLMGCEGLSLRAAFHAVKKGRLTAYPNLGFIRQLQKYSRVLAAEGTYHDKTLSSHRSVHASFFSVESFI